MSSTYMSKLVITMQLPEVLPVMASPVLVLVDVVLLALVVPTSM